MVDAYPDLTEAEIEANLKELSPRRRMRLRQLKEGYLFYTPGVLAGAPMTEAQRSRLQWWDEFIADPNPHMPGPVRPRPWSSLRQQAAVNMVDPTACGKCGHEARLHYFGSKGDSTSVMSTKPGCNGCRGDQALCTGYVSPP